MRLSEYIEKFGDKQVDVDKLSEFIIEDKVFVPKIGESYYYLTESGVNGRANANQSYDFNVCKVQQVYRTRAEAEFARDKAIFLEFMRKEFLRNSDVIDWEDDSQTKYDIHYNHARNSISVYAANICQRKGFFTTGEDWLYEFIDEHEDDIKKYYFEIKGEN